MKFMCFCYYDPKKVSEFSPEVFEDIKKECAPHDEALTTAGRKVVLGSMDDPEAARSVRPVDGEAPSVTLGAFLASQEQIGAFFILEAKDIDEAVQIASLHPSGHLGKYFGGGIEVRACNDYETY